MSLVLHQCTLEDLDELRRISIETFHATFARHNKPENMTAYMDRAYAPEQLKKELLEEDSAFYFLYADQTLVGYLKLNNGSAQSEPMGENALEVERIYIRTAYKRCGYGSHLLQEAEEIARKMQKNKIWLGVWEHNTNALAFYKRHGFIQVSAHSFYMGDEEQIDYIMEKQVTVMDES